MINWISWKFKTSAHQKARHSLGEIFPIYVSDNGLIARILNYKKRNEPKKVKDLNIHFMKEDTAISNMHMKRGLTSLTIRQAQTETIIFIATSEENDHTHTQKCETTGTFMSTCTSMYSSIIQNSPKLETTQLFIIRKINE